MPNLSTSNFVRNLEAPRIPPPSIGHDLPPWTSFAEREDVLGRKELRAEAERAAPA